MVLSAAQIASSSSPEYQRRTGFGAALRLNEIAARKQRRGANHDGNRRHHRRRNAVGAQRNAERGLPSAHQINQRTAAAPHRNEDRGRDTEARQQ